MKYYVTIGELASLLKCSTRRIYRICSSEFVKDRVLGNNFCPLEPFEEELEKRYSLTLEQAFSKARARGLRKLDLSKKRKLVANKIKALLKAGGVG